MSLSRRILSTILLLAAAPLAGQERSVEESRSADFPTGQVVEEVVTLDGSGHSYALYLPSDYAADRQWPVLYVLDPRGRALMALDLFRAAAERNGFIVVSSYQSRSDTDMSVTTRAFQALLNDIPRRFAFDPQRLVVAGMSGTAHASWGFAQALEDRLAGVIACAGGVQTSTYGRPEDEVGFAYYGITGTDDFNYQEMMELEAHLDEVGSPHHFEVFDGRHGWAPRESLQRAVDWMTLRFTFDGFEPPSEDFVQEQLAARRGYARSLTGPLDRLRHYQSMKRDFAGRGFAAEDQEELDRLESSDEVAAAARLERKLAGRERAYLTSRLGPWNRMLVQDQNPPGVGESLVRLQIGSLVKRSQDPDPRRATSARRLMETVYTQASFYLPRSLEAQGEIDRAEIALKVAAEIFPDRALTYWRMANLFLDAGWHQRAMEALQEVAERGDVIVTSVQTDSRWEPLHQEPGWPRLVEALESGR